MIIVTGLTIYSNLRPGGWIEQLELLPEFDSEDNALPLNSPLKQWSSLGIQAAFNSGHPFGLYHRCTDFIRQAGFVDVHEEVRKWPVGAWPRDQQLKEGGSVNLEHWSAGMEGYTMYLFTNFGVPTPWSKEEVQVLLAQARKDLRNPRHHLYHRAYVTIFSNRRHSMRANVDSGNEFGLESHFPTRL
jgi:hypothetical protein